MAQSLAEAAALAGVSITFGCPATHRPSDTFLAHLIELGGHHNITARAFTSPVRAVKEVDVIYTDVWTSMGDEQFVERNTAALLPYQVDTKLMKAAAPHAIFMHCLPAHRGEEVTDEVIDGIQSVVFDQAENRLHVQKALLLALHNRLKGLRTIKPIIKPPATTPLRGSHGNREFFAIPRGSTARGPQSPAVGGRGAWGGAPSK